MAVPLLSQGRHGAQSKLVEYLDPAFLYRHVLPKNTQV